MTHDKENGYIAVVSAMVIMTVLLLLATTTSMASFYSRFNALDRENKKVGTALAESCVDSALLKLAMNSSYLGNETVSVGSNSCKICPVSAAGQIRNFSTKATYNQTVTNFAVKSTLNANSLSINSWQEIPTNNSC